MELIADPIVRANVNTILNIVMVVAIFFGGLAGRIQALRLKQIKEHVANDHVDENGKPINLREEMDRRYYESNANQKQIVLALNDVRVGVKDIREDMNVVKRRQLEQDISIDALQNTQTRAEVAKTLREKIDNNDT